MLGASGCFPALSQYSGGQLSLPRKNTFKGISIFKGGFTNPPRTIAKRVSMPMPLNDKISACFHLYGWADKSELFQGLCFWISKLLQHGSGILLASIWRLLLNVGSRQESASCCSIWISDAHTILSSWSNSRILPQKLLSRSLKDRKTAEFPMSRKLSRRDSQFPWHLPHIWSKKAK